MNLKSNTQEIERKLITVRKGIEEAAAASGRKRDDITLVAVTKEASLPQVRKVLQLGVKDIGENRAKELLLKLDIFREWNPNIHFIGNLQTNKVKKIIDYVSMIQSVDRNSLLEEISKRADRAHREIDILMEINISGEKTKSGVNPENALEFAGIITNYKQIRLRGLMTIAPFIPSRECRPYFRKMKEIYDEISEQLQLSYFDTLSMGMSNDYKVAIEEGATMVRIGRGIFGGE